MRIRITATRTKLIRAGALLGALCLFTSLWLMVGELGFPQITSQKELVAVQAPAWSYFARIHHLESTHDGPDLRSCPSWNETLPGAWQVEGVQKGHGEALFGTAHAQSEIYKWQHPQNCADKKFLVHKAQVSGIGSFIHQAGIALANAMNLDRIMIFENPDDHPYLQDEFCKDLMAIDACYFLPISNCTAGLEVPQTSAIPQINTSDPSQPNEKFIYEHMGYQAERYAVPNIFHAMLEGSAIPQRKRFYWWRAQAAAYMVRLNDRSKEYVQQLRERTFPDTRPLNDAISVHIRRGDKWKEAAPTNDTQYDAAAQFLYNGSAAGYCEPPNCVKKELFISTEDSSAIDYFVNETDWNVRYVDNPILLKTNTQQWSHEYALQVGPVKDMLGSILNLELALECSAWVGTLSSNWCRLIDQMRATIGCKAHLPFIDPVSPEPYRNDLGP